MKSTCVYYQSSSKIFLIDNFFPNELLENLLQIFENIEDPLWVDSEIFEHRRGRLIYTGNTKTINQLNWFAQSSELVDSISKMIEKSVRFDSASLWADFEGYAISPHTDPNYFKHAIQIFVTRESTSWNTAMHGTTIYQTEQEALFQMPYRNNFGYLFETPSAVLHGLGTQVPVGLQRNSVYLRYN
jgi:hypothetical protein